MLNTTSHGNDRASAETARRASFSGTAAGPGAYSRRNLYLGVAALALVAAGGSFAPKPAMAQAIQTTPTNLNVTDIGTILNNRPRSFDNGGAPITAVGTNGVDIQVRLQMGQTVFGTFVPAGSPFDSVGDININVGDVTATSPGRSGINATNAAGDINIVAGNVHSDSTGVNAEVKGGNFSIPSIPIVLPNGYSLSFPGSGNINLDLGNVTSDNGNGINATTGFGTVTVSAGDVTAENGFGVNATTSVGLGYSDLSGLLGTGGGGGFDPLALLGNTGVTVDVGNVSSEDFGINAEVEGATVLGFDVPGIGNVDVSAGNVTSTQSFGINATTGIGLVTVAAGDVSAGGSFGVNATTGLGLVAVNVGNVTAEGQGINAQVTGLTDVPFVGDVDAMGVVLVTANNVTSETAGGVNATTGLGAAIVIVDDVESFGTGINTQVDTGLALAFAGDVTTQDDGATGMNVTAEHGVAVAVSTGHVQTTGDNAYGVNVEAGSVDLSILDPFTTQIDDILADAGIPVSTGDIVDIIEGGVAIAAVNDVTTAGDGAVGVNASAPDGIAGVIALGDVTTTGDGANGIQAYGDEFAFVFANDVSATGANSHGIVADASSGSALVIADTVKSNGAVGVGAFGGTGFAAVAVSEVSTEGDNARGIDAFVNEGDVYVVAGTVSTEGDNSEGIHGWTDDGSTYIVAGDVVTQGANSAGIVNHANGTSVTIFNTIETFGPNSPGVDAYDGPSNVIVAGVSVLTHGANSAGILAESVNDDVTVVVGEVSTEGFNSLGIRALTEDGDVFVGVGSVETDGAFSDGVIADSLFGDAIVIAGTVSTEGFGSDGIAALAGDDATVVVGTVSTEGHFADGIVASAGDDATVIAGSVTTGGNFSDAIFADAWDDATVIAGTVSTTGFGSDGITAWAGDDATVVVDTVSTEGHFAHGIEALADDDATVIAGSVTTTGDFSDAIFASALDDATVIAGTVSTTGFGSDGITAWAGDDATVVVESVTTEGHFAHGIEAVADDDATVVAGSVTTSGDFSDGIVADALDDATVIAGSVSTTGFGSDGITALAGDDAFVLAGTVSTEGDFAHGILAEAGDDATVVVDEVSTAGDFSDGIQAYAGDDATVFARIVSTLGFGSDGITAEAGDDATVVVESVSTAGDFAHGILADAGDDATVVAGSVTTEGDFSDGITAIAGDDATVIAGSVTTTGFGSDGITAEAGDDATVVVGTVSTAGHFADGIQAYAGDDAIVVADSVTTAGDFSDGITAVAGDDATVVVGSVSTLGFGSDGITALAGDNAFVLAETVSTEGHFATGIEADAANGVAIVIVDEVSTLGDFAPGIVASSYEGTFVLSGTVTTQGEDSHGIIASASDGNVFVDAVVTEAAQGSAILTFASENAYVRVRETARGEGTVANPVIGGLAGENYVLLIDEGAVVESTDGDTFDVAVQVAAGDEVVILNQGIVNGTMLVASVNGNTVLNDLGAEWNWSGFNAFVSGGDNTLINNGIANAGPFSASLFASANGDNTITNNNQLNATGFNAFVFSAPNGSSTFNNNSWVRVNGFTSFIGLDDYNNAALTDMQDGDANDAILMTGNFNAIGANSTLAIDAELTPGGTADLLLVGGNVTGVTSLAVNDLDNGPGQYDPNGVLFAVVDGTTNVTNFTTNGGIDKGLFRYDAYLRPDTSTLSGENEWYLASTMDREAYEFPIIAAGAQNLWHASTGTWLDRTADLRSAFGDPAPEIVDLKNEGAVAAKPSMVTPGAWLKLFGGTQERDISNTSAPPSGMLGQSHTYDDVFTQRHYGFMVGIDGGRDGDSPNEAWLAGVMAGYTGSDLEFDRSRTDVDYKMGSIGAYVSYLNAGFFADAALKADFGKIDYSSDLGNGFGDSFKSDFTSVGVILDTGYRFNNPSGWFFEPKATLAYVHTSYDDGDVLGTEVSFDNGESLRGRLGARVGNQLHHNGNIIEPWLEGSVWHEFKGDYAAVFDGNGNGASVDYDLGGTFGEVAGGLSFINMGNGWSGFSKGAVQFGSDSYLGFTGNLGVRKTW